MWPFRKKKAEPPPKDGMGFDLVPNPNGGGMKVSDESIALWREWTKQNPPPDDGWEYQSSPLSPHWQRVGYKFQPGPDAPTEVAVSTTTTSYRLTGSASTYVMSRTINDKSE